MRFEKRSRPALFSNTAFRLQCQREHKRACLKNNDRAAPIEIAPAKCKALTDF